MVIIGGIGSSEKYMSDIIALDLEKMRWVNCSNIGKFDNIFEKGGLAYAGCCSIYDDHSI